MALWPACGGFECATSGIGDVAAGDAEQQCTWIEEPVGRMQSSALRFGLGGVPTTELLVDGVA